MIDFRRTTIDDIPTIRTLARRIWEEAYSQLLSKAQIEYMLEMMYSSNVIECEITNGTVWELIYFDGEAVGYISYALGKDNSVKLSKIYISEINRGRGIADAALKRVIRYAVVHERSFVYLTVNKENKRAIRAYEKNGFSIAESVVTDIGNGFVMDDHIMKYYCTEAGKRDH
jgi:ribosomal protein S18 acetylase RimI-like enzyme